MSGGLRGVTFRLSSRCRTSYSMGRHVLLGPLYPSGRVVIAASLCHAIGRVKFRLFSHAIVRRGPSPMCAFIRHCLLRLLLASGSRKVQRLLRRDGIVIHLKRGGHLLARTELLSILERVGSTRSFVVAASGDHCAVM